MHSSSNAPLAAAVFAACFAFASAKTDLSGCTTTDVSSPAGASVAWYVPGTYELCDPLDCGGGRAPPKTTVPGCPMYTGTETYSPSFLAGYGAAAETAAPSATASADATTTSNEAAPMITSSSSMSSSSFDWASLESQAATSESSWDLYTDTTNTMTSTTAAASSSAVIVTGGSSSSSSSEQQLTIQTSMPSMSPTTYSNGTVATPKPYGGSNNGTLGNSTATGPSASQTVSEGGAMATAGVWVGSVGMVAGLGALVAVL